ncbi:TIGR02270 family protein [Pyxidicoccus xibeiensis]|uniref:TIGR02270 family protein n=1 Tax=Pyxidicoccus xibeiensis TaxID=2906759 RepID=UPI0020A7CCA6|nr:TIGR02270 family protein [Pyxidicoccus xibeiensis]MCP3143952.1 TIGR02270 family protein [Pyxidicoccus xibeiensis]
MSRSTEPGLAEPSSAQKEIFEEHLGEAAFLWTQWEAALGSPHLTLGDVTEGDEHRLLAHLDALAQSASPGVEALLGTALESSEADTVTAGALALLYSGEERHLQRILELFQEDEARRSLLQRALELCGNPSWAPRLLPLLRSEAPALVAATLEVLGFWGHEPDPDLDWRLLLAHVEPRIQAAALRLARVTPGRVEAAWLREALESPSPAVRDEALLTGLLSGAEGVWSRCRRLVERSSGHGRLAMMLLGMEGRHPENLALLQARLAEPGACADALWALGISGCVEAAESCLPLLEDTSLGGLAAEAFCCITGLRLEGRFKAQPGDEQASAPGASWDGLAPGTTGVELPRASLGAVREWWQQERTRFRPGLRYLWGQPLTPAWMLESLELLPMRRRHALALEVLLRSRGACQVPTRAFSEVQRSRLLTARAGMHRLLVDRPLEGRGAEPPARARVPGPIVSGGQAPRPSVDASRMLAVTGGGMVSAIGDGAASSCAASRAGVVRISALEGYALWDEDLREVEPARGHQVSWLTDGFSGLGRLIVLGSAALRDLHPAVRQDDWRRSAVFLVTGNDFYRGMLQEEAPHAEEREWLRGQCLHRLIPATLRAAGVQGAPRTQEVLFGEVGFLQALQRAREQLERGVVERCIIGGVDTLVEPHLLRALDQLGLLKGPERAVGLLPGEAAAFLVLERADAARRHGASVQALVESPSIGAEPFHRFSREPAVGAVLAEVIAQALGGDGGAGGRTGLVIAGLNGDEYRARDWGHALIRLRGRRLLPEDCPEWYPAISFGDVGAAAGPLAVLLAAHAFRRRYAGTDAALLWMVGDDGSRGALRLRASHPLMD